MGNVAAFKARLTLESAEYMAGWKKVEAATTNSVGGIEAAIQKGMKSWSRSMGKAVGGFLGIQMADTLLKSIDDTLKNPIFNNAGSNIAYAIGDGLASTLEGIPVAGTLGKWIGAGIGAVTDKIGEMADWASKKLGNIPGASTILGFVGTSAGGGGMEERQKASREEAMQNERRVAVYAKLAADMEKQAQLAGAMNQQQREKLEREQRFSEIASRMNDAMLKEGATGKEIQAARDRLRVAYDAIYKAQQATNEALQKQLDVERNIEQTRARQREAHELEKEQLGKIAELNQQIFEAKERIANTQGRSLKPAADAARIEQEHKERLEKIEELEQRISDIQYFKLEGAASNALTETERNALISEKLTLQAIVNNEKLIDQKQRQLEIARQAAQIAEDSAAEEKKRIEQERRRQESAASFIQRLQDALDQRTMTEAELFRKEMERNNLNAEEQARALALNEKLKAASQTTAMVGNVESISTAVGAVKMAGTSTGLDRLAKPAEQTAKATTDSAKSLARMAAATGSV